MIRYFATGTLIAILTSGGMSFAAEPDSDAPAPLITIKSDRTAGGPSALDRLSGALER
jgi:hypothetical protein